MQATMSTWTKNSKTQVDKSMFYEPERWNPLVSVRSMATSLFDRGLDTRSHRPTIKHEPHSAVSTITVDPATKPMPTSTCSCAAAWVAAPNPEATYRKQRMVQNG